MILRSPDDCLKDCGDEKVHLGPPGTLGENQMKDLLIQGGHKKYQDFQPEN